MAYEFITYRVADRIAYVTINRPEVMNALHAAANAEMLDAFTAFRDDPAWKAALKASEEKAGGPLTMPKNGVKSVMMKATDYSPIR